MNKRPDPKVVARACYDALAELGIRRKYGIGNLEIDETVIGWIGLNQGVHPTFIRMNPNIGVHFIPVMKLLADVGSNKYRKGEYPTLSYPLGEACSKFKQFIFESEADIFAEAARLSLAIKDYGIPFIRSLASYSAMLPRVHKEIFGLGGAAERYAAALYLSGDIVGAFDFLNVQISTYVEKHYVDEAEKMNLLKLYLEAHSKL